MDYLIFDIETIVDRERIERAEGDYDAYAAKLAAKQDTADPFVPWPYHRPVVLAGAYLGQKEVKAILYLGTPRDIACKFWASYHHSARPAPTLVTWNGRGFDLPVLEAEAIRWGHKLGRWMMPPGTKSWEDPRGRFSGYHVDLMDWVANSGGAPRPSLNAYAAAIGVPGKLGTGGGDVKELHAAGEIDSIGAYCATDVLTTLAVFLKIGASIGAFREGTDDVEEIAGQFSAMSEAHASAVGAWAEKWNERTGGD
ncbi:MAG: hypothetical protein GY719_26045 [bacterium]|nr:hypothetical protein [bacterium]